MFEQYFNKRMALLDTESAFRTLARARALEARGRSVIHMEIGQPDFPTPRNVAEAGRRAIGDGCTGYAPTPGFPELRRAIADYAAKYKNVNASPDEVVVVPGAKPVMFFTMLMLIEPGDEVIYPNPSFPIYESLIKYTGGAPVPVPLKPDDGFRLDLDAFRRSVTDKTKLVILNNPANPTGGVYADGDIAQIADILKGYPGVFVLSDEIYDRLVYDGGVTSIASMPEMKDRTIILDGFSKTYAMTGWRLGYGIMHRELAERMELLAVNSFSCAAAFTQMAAVEALTGPQDAVDEMREAFRERRDYLVGALNAIGGIRCQTPGGAFYVFPDISAFGLNSEAFATRLLDEAGVAASSGASFGRFGEGFIRLSYAASLENIKIAAERIAAFVRTI